MGLALALVGAVVLLGFVGLVVCLIWRGNFPSLSTPDGRRAWAFVAIVGGSIVFTMFAAVGVYIVRGDIKLSFYLALAAHGQVIVGLLGLATMFNKSTKHEIRGPGGTGFTSETVADDVVRTGDTVTVEKTP